VTCIIGLLAATSCKNKRMRTSYVPVMHCEKMAVSDVSYRQRDVIEFPVKEGNSEGVIYE
jgi:hypothetical protein